MLNKCIKRKIFNPLICFVILGIFIFGLCNMKMNAEDTKDLSVDITYGFNGTTKTNSTAPITISVTNKGSEINGKVQVILSSVLNTNTTVQSMILSGAKEKNYMYEKSVLIAANTTTDITMIIPIMSKTNTLKIIIYDEYGNVVSVNQKVIESDTYYYFVYAAIISDDPVVLNYFENTALYQLNDYTFKATILGEDDIPDENYSLELFDIIITNQSQLDSLTKEQQKVINNWEKNDGFLIKLSENQDISWENIIPEEELKKLDYSYRTYADWSITYALSKVFMSELPKFTVYVTALIIYILLMGPLLYIVLKKLNKRKFFWLCEISGSVLFTILIIMIGSSTRFNAPFINYFKIVSFRDKTIDDSVYFNIQAPFNNEYKLYLDKEYSFRPIYETIYYEEQNKKAKTDNYNVGISYGDEENTITIKNDVAFTKEYFYAEKTEEANGTDYINVNMKMFGGKVYGSVVNNLDYPIENAAILIYNKVIFLNTIPANSIINLDNMKIYTYNPKFNYGLTNEIAGVEMDKNGVIKDGYMLENQKKTILDFYLEKNFGVYTDKAYLVGFTKDINKLELQLDSAYDAYGMTMIETPINVDYTYDNQQYTTYVPIKNEEYSSSGDIMYTDEMILTYSLGQNLSDINLYFNDLSYYDDKYYKAFSGHIYFYNRNTTLYDPVDLSKKSVSSEELKPYLNEKNEIVIKYVEHFGEEEKQALLPSLSTIGRVNDVKD